MYLENAILSNCQSQGGDGWDWGDDDFIKDQDSNWTDITPEDAWEGVGRLIQETQLLSEILILSQTKYLNVFKDKRQHYTRKQLDSNLDVQELRKSTLGTLLHKLNDNVDYKYEKDVRTLERILNDRNYFVHQFFYETMRNGYDIDDLNKDVRRLKTAINTTVKFNNRYRQYVREALYKGEDCFNEFSFYSDSSDDCDDEYYDDDDE